MPKKLILFIDGGDTLVEEGSIKRDEDDVVQSSEAIPGALETLRVLKDSGYTICLVDDVRNQSVTNVFMANGHLDCFAAVSTSEEAGVTKPSAGIFENAMKKLGLEPEDKKRIIMVGNSCRADIAGANRFGITSVLMDWSPRYNMTPQNADEVPDFIIHKPEELTDLLERLEGEKFESTKEFSAN
ncbi:MAG: HAD family hydrolase [Lachnospiraceae bacterium]|nr:HAD family hydrolase [Lachnospiraceae bacterium]